MKPSIIFFTAILALARGLGADTGLAPQTQPTGLWATLYVEDISSYAANLRNAGCPEPTVGVIISQEINARFKDREEKLQPSTVSVKSLREDFSPERREALVLLQLEKNALLRAALDSVPEEITRIDWTPGALAHLAPAQRDTVRLITDDYDTMIARVITESHGHFLDEDREKLRFLESERDIDLGKLLSTDEILDFDLARTSFGREVRNRLKLFVPTQEQLRTYLAIGKKLGLDYEKTERNPTRRREEQSALNAELAKVWGPTVYTRYRCTTSLPYEQIFNLVQRLNLGPDIAEEIFASQKSTTEQGYAVYVKWRQSAERSRTTPTFPPPSDMVIFDGPSITSDPRRAERVAQMLPLIKAHCELVQARLGPSGYNEYLELNRRWVEAMQNGGAARLDYSTQ
jgi:hypothetical protein